MEPITVEPLLYVLKLENEKYYVGVTYNLNFRYAQHIQGHGARWTKLHKPVGITEVRTQGSTSLENLVTLEYIDKYGKENVRGGSYTSIPK
jgi:predicted GIY-YIG superfamily endonuclease